MSRRGTFALMLLWALTALFALWATFYAHPIYGDCHQSDLGRVCKLIHY